MLPRRRCAPSPACGGGQGGGVSTEGFSKRREPPPGASRRPPPQAGEVEEARPNRFNLNPFLFSAYLYESGSGESDGLANSFLSSEPIGTLRFSPLGGIFCVNHLS